MDIYWNLFILGTLTIIVHCETPEKETGPDPCSTSDGGLSKIDAAASIRDEVFLFKDEWFWRIPVGDEFNKEPMKISDFWFGLPLDIKKVDAVYERPDGRIVFFIGNRYWLFDDNSIYYNFPTSGLLLTGMGLPNTTRHVDAAFTWGPDKHTYIITGEVYWQYDERTRSMSEDYPRNMALWTGVPLPVDAAFTNKKESVTNFLRGSRIWRYTDDGEVTGDTGLHWFQCNAAMSSYGMISSVALLLPALASIIMN